MERVNLPLQDACLIRLDVFSDDRGWFCETYSQEKIASLGILEEFVQDNHSYNRDKGILRGLHCQVGEFSQAKLLRCIQGEILDVIVDVRKTSPTYLQHAAVHLSGKLEEVLYIPSGFLHGYLTLTTDCEVQYKVSQVYEPKADRSVRYDDPLFGIHWGIENPILSKKDRECPFFLDSDVEF